MRTKQCKHCGVVFDTDRQGKYLCDACAAASRRASVYRERTCIDCGATFMGYPKSKRCPACQKIANDASSAANRRTGPKRPLGSTDHCELCGAEYVVEGGKQRYCKACAQSATLDNVRAHKRAYNAENAEHLAAQKQENRRDNKVCVVCGRVFDTDTSTVTCSPECARRRLAQTRAKAEKNRKPRKRS